MIRTEIPTLSDVFSLHVGLSGSAASGTPIRVLPRFMSGCERGAEPPAPVTYVIYTWYRSAGWCSSPVVSIVPVFSAL